MGGAPREGRPYPDLRLLFILSPAVFDLPQLRDATRSNLEIRSVFGESWDIPGELVIRDDLVQRVIGYPTSIVLDDGHVFTVYWDEDAVGVTSIVGTFYMP